jgi:hypothetical protein
MSAAAARRRKQLAAKKSAEEAQTPLTTRLTNLLAENEDSAAYEALQLAHSQVRRLIASDKGDEGADLAYDVSLQFLSHGRVSVASQLLALLAEVLMEVPIETTSSWVEKITTIDTNYKTALEPMKAAQPSEYDRLMRLHYNFLKKIVKWSADWGTVKFGDLKCHSLLGEQCWLISSTAPPDEEDEEEFGKESLRAECIMHLALAEQPQRIGELLAALPAPTPEEEKMGRGGGTAAERDCFLTRAIVVFIAMENLRDANILVKNFMEDIDTRNHKKLAKSYMNKNDGMAPTHVIFCCMLLRICEKDRAGPLFQWLLRSFAVDLAKFRPDLKVYTTKIGRVYFGIQPPPSMMNMMENMMAMMAGGGMMAPGMAGM